MTTTYLRRLLDPWSEFDRMGRYLERNTRCGTCEYPLVNVWVNGEHAEISSEMPGVDRNAIDISVEGNTLTLKGERSSEKTEKGDSWHRHEIPNGSFRKIVQLPFNIDAEKVTASYKNGVLHVSVPQMEAEKPKKIEIKS